MSSDNEVSQLSSPVQYDTDTFVQELASDAPPPPPAKGKQPNTEALCKTPPKMDTWGGGWTWGGEGT